MRALTFKRIFCGYGHRMRQKLPRMIASALSCAVLFMPATIKAADAPPAMILPGQFNVNAYGAATYTIPIAVPPGTAGMTPVLSLDYSSQASDGIVGLGWSLNGLPSIGRCPRSIAQDGYHGSVNYDDSGSTQSAINDRFCLDGQRLIVVGGIYGRDGSEYRTEIDGFSKIIAHGDSGINGPSWFEVHTKSGQTMEFGHSSVSRVWPITAAGVQVTTVVRSWPVSQITDSVGNYMTVSYSESALGEARPERIDYTGHVSSPTSYPYNSVVFNYTPAGQQRADQWPIYQAGMVQQTPDLLLNVTTYAGSTAVYQYKLDYRMGTATQHSRVTAVTLCAGAGACNTPCSGASNCLATTQFTWQGGTPATMPHNAVANNIAHGKWVHFGNGTFFVQNGVSGSDFNGDGINDLIVLEPDNAGVCPQGNTIYYGVGDAAGSFVPADMQSSFGSEHGLSTYLFYPDGDACFYYQASGGAAHAPPFSVVSDLDADGLTDVLALDLHGNADMFMKNDGSGNFNHQTPNPTNVMSWPGDYNGDGLIDGTTNEFFLNQPSQPGTFVSSGPVLPSTGGINDDRTFGGDYDGDGCADLLYQVASGPKAIYYSPLCTSGKALQSVPDWVHNGQTIVPGDFNGDGKTDILITSKSDTGKLWLSTGTGLVAQTFAVPWGWGKFSIVTGDWNNDGKTDIALIAPGGDDSNYGVGVAHVVMLSTGTGFVQQFTIPNNDDRDKDPQSESASVGDWNSDGATDLWLQKPSGDFEELMSTDGSLPYVPETIAAIDNGIGARTNVGYDRLNNPAIYSKGDASAYPKEIMTGAVYVVSRVDSSNGQGTCVLPSMVNCYSSTYSYQGATMDLSGRGFMGFQKMTVDDLQTHISRATTYRVDFRYTGLIARQQSIVDAQGSNCIANTLLDDTTNTYNTVQNASGASFFTFLTGSISVKLDCDRSALPQISTSYLNQDGTSSYDAFGNPQRVTETTSTATDSSTKLTINSFSNDPVTWHLGRLTRSVVTNSAPGTPDIIRTSSFAYDASTGLLTQEVIEPNGTACDGSDTLCLETDYGYDNFGNRNSVKTIALTAAVAGAAQTLQKLTRTTKPHFNTANGEFADQITDAMNKVEHWQFDPSFGKATQKTDHNGLITAWSSDPFGRQYSQTQADTTASKTEYFYCAGINGGTFANCPAATGAFAKRVTPMKQDLLTQNGPIAVTYYDSLSRQIATDIQGFGGQWIRQETKYDALGRVYQTSRPYFRDTGSPAYTTNTSFDGLGRLTQQNLPDGGYTVYTYSGVTTTQIEHVIRPDAAHSSVTETRTTVKNARGLTASVSFPIASYLTTYTYDALGNVLAVTDPSSNVAANQYDLRGRKTSTNDPDLGSWTYSYDGYANLYQQTDAKSQTTTLSYDPLNRVIKRTEADLVSQWIYGTSAAQHNIDRLVTTCTGSCAGSDYSRVQSFDSAGRPNQTTLNISGSTYNYMQTYDPATGRPTTLTYPSGLSVQYNYDSALGYQISITDTAAPHTTYWTADSRDAEMHLTQTTAANNIRTIQNFDANTGLIQQTRASSVGQDDGATANFSYFFDTHGNLAIRGDMDGGYTEAFCYDSANRLKNYWLNGTYDCSATSGKSVSYDPTGNIQTKSDVGRYNYPTPGAGSVHPHAVTFVNGTPGLLNGVQNPHFDYDANGNMTCEHTSASCTGNHVVTTVGYTSFNMAATVVQASTSYALTYGSDHSRIVQSAVIDGTTVETLYLNDPTSGAMSEYVAAGTQGTWHDYLFADGHMVAERSKSQFSTSWMYFVLDHLGSIAVITGQDGSVVTNGRLSYDAWGRSRLSNGQDDPTCNSAATAPTTRGFTGQEEMGAVCLINFNARIYDPTLGRFMSADPMIGSIFDLQQLNRYSYVTNNPLSLVDPSGMCFLGCFWHNVFKALRGPLEFAVMVVATYVVGPEASSFVDGVFGITVESFGEAGFAAFNGAVSQFVASGITAGASGGSWDSVLLSTVQGGVNGALGTWHTSDWPAPERPGEVGLSDVTRVKTDWPAVLLKSSIAAGMNVFAARGRNSDFAFLSGFTTTFADELYQSYVPQQPAFIGDGDGGGFKRDDTQLLLGKNNFGKFRVDNGEAQGRYVEGEPFSRFMDGDVPGMRAISYVHDVWSGMYHDNLCLGQNTCGTMMVPAAILSYAALAGNLPLNAFGSVCDRQRRHC